MKVLTDMSEGLSLGHPKYQVGMASCQDQEARWDGVISFASKAEAPEDSWGKHCGDSFIECLCTEHVHVLAVKTTHKYNDLDFPNELQEV